MRRILALDIGSKRIGVAISDPLMITAQPFTTLHRKNLQEDLQKISLLVEQQEVQEVVIGLPRDMQGTYSKSALDILDFKKYLEEFLPVPVVVWDERLSTVAMERFLLDQDVSRQKRRQVIDKMAACYILEGYMSYLKNKEPKNE